MPIEVKEIENGILRCVSQEKEVFFVARDSETPPAAAGRPGNGGIRVQEYSHEEMALDEARFLAKCMTHKPALYNTGFSGAKIVAHSSSYGDCKQALMDAISQVLHQLGGTVYTGCDLNTDQEDMDHLAKQCPYVLAGIDSGIDPSEATACGVYGAILAALGNDTTNISNKRFLVHGMGKVGKGVARQLEACGAEIFSYDIFPRNADHPQFCNVSDCVEWWKLPFDLLILCSASNIITPTIARQLACESIIGSTNKPFSDTELVVDILKVQGIPWIPEAVSSAGAVICDSIEYYAPDIFQKAGADEVYSFIRDLVRDKARQLIDYCHNGVAIIDAMTQLIYQKDPGPVCGLTFQIAKPVSVSEVLK